MRGSPGSSGGSRSGGPFTDTGTVGFTDDFDESPTIIAPPSPPHARTRARRGHTLTIEEIARDRLGEASYGGSGTGEGGASGERRGLGSGSAGEEGESVMAAESWTPLGSKDKRQPTAAAAIQLKEIPPYSPSGGGKKTLTVNEIKPPFSSPTGAGNAGGVGGKGGGMALRMTAQFEDIPPFSPSRGSQSPSRHPPPQPPHAISPISPSPRDPTTTPGHRARTPPFSIDPGRSVGGGSGGGGGYSDSRRGGAPPSSSSTANMVLHDNDDVGGGESSDESSWDGDPVKLEARLEAELDGVAVQAKSDAKQAKANQAKAATAQGTSHSSKASTAALSSSLPSSSMPSLTSNAAAPVDRASSSPISSYALGDASSSSSSSSRSGGVGVERSRGGDDEEEDDEYTTYKLMMFSSLAANRRQNSPSSQPPPQNMPPAQDVTSAEGSSNSAGTTRNSAPGNQSRSRR